MPLHRVCTPSSQTVGSGMVVGLRTRHIAGKLLDDEIPILGVMQAHVNPTCAHSTDISGVEWGDRELYEQLMNQCDNIHAVGLARILHNKCNIAEISLAAVSKDGGMLFEGHGRQSYATCQVERACGARVIALPLLRVTTSTSNATSEDAHFPHACREGEGICHGDLSPHEGAISERFTGENTAFTRGVDDSRLRNRIQWKDIGISAIRLAAYHGDRETVAGSQGESLNGSIGCWNQLIADLLACDFHIIDTGRICVSIDNRSVRTPTCHPERLFPVQPMPSLYRARNPAASEELLDVSWSTRSRCVPSVIALFSYARHGAAMMRSISTFPPPVLVFLSQWTISGTITLSSPNERVLVQNDNGIFAMNEFVLLFKISRST
ncbi:hypothetical protein EVG20_g10854 [Dentipellis fragilis]|uniref:Uncharacterized protein n=1 Tax=Dentipellis fragilis TaxID=205917 RepID=A0A4Y9XNS0_9AGAM|nr:hypothetical protein EVG20_g10854 [Dentipellis fragilis]